MDFDLQLFAEETPTVEDLQAQVLKLTDENKQLTDDLTTANSLTTKSAERIKELEEHNQKLFLRVTTKVEDKKDDKGEPEKRTIEGLIKKMEGEQK